MAFQNDFEEIPCIFCDIRQEQFVFETPDYNQRCPGLFRIVRCKGCGLVYLNPRPTQKAMPRYYPLEEWTRVKEERNPEEARINGWHWRQVMERRCAPILTRKKNGKILEIGCGDGYFLRYLLEQGWECIGFEPAPEAARYAMEKLGLNVRTDPFDEIDFPEESFDVVTLYAAIEHLPNPLETLKKATALLKRDGILYVGSIPNFDSFERRLFGKRWVAINSPRHLYHFTPSTFYQLLGKAGLRPVETGMFSYEGTCVMGYTHSLRYLLQECGLSVGQKSETDASLEKRLASNKRRNAFLKEALHKVEYLVFRTVGQISDALRKGSMFWVIAVKGDW